MKRKIVYSGRAGGLRGVNIVIFIPRIIEKLTKDCYITERMALLINCEVVLGTMVYFSGLWDIADY